MTENSQIKLITCQTLGEEFKSLLPDDFEIALLDYKLSDMPKLHHPRLQTEIDAASSQADTILIGYGWSGGAIFGLKSSAARMVIPQIYDCVALLLGSNDEYKRQMELAPGTFYLSRGLIESGHDPYKEFCAMRERYDEKKAMRGVKIVLKGYTRIAYIDSGNHPSSLESDREYAKMIADRFDLSYEEIPGSNLFMKKFIEKEWDDDFVIVEPGEEVRYDHFNIK